MESPPRVPGESNKIINCFLERDSFGNILAYIAGTAVFIATCASLSYHTQQDAGTREVLIGKFHRSGYPHIDSICCKGSKSVVRLHETEESYLVAAVNHQTEPSEINVEFTAGFTVQKTLRFTVAGLTGTLQTILKKK